MHDELFQRKKCNGGVLYACGSLIIRGFISVYKDKTIKNMLMFVCINGAHIPQCGLFF